MSFGARFDRHARAGNKPLFLNSKEAGKWKQVAICKLPTVGDRIRCIISERAGKKLSAAHVCAQRSRFLPPPTISSSSSSNGGVGAKLEHVQAEQTSMSCNSTHCNELFFLSLFLCESIFVRLLSARERIFIFNVCECLCVCENCCH